MAGLERMGITHVAYEASSHGLDQYRAEGVPVSAAAFTNFSRDHLDYHADMDAYFEAKMRLFDEVVAPDGTAVIWTDDPKSDEVIERCRSARASSCSPSGRRGETIRAGRARSRPPLGQTADASRHDGKEHTPRAAADRRLPGGQCADRGRAGAGDRRRFGDDACPAWRGVPPVRGRLERAVISRAGAPVYVDYAHTPDAIEAAIAALRPHVEGPADHRVRRRRRPRPGQAARNGRGRGAAVATW